MEFFEKAHVPKKELMKKGNRSEAIVKKQLKQMLYGYKNSDNRLIKESADLSIAVSDNPSDFEESSSVSGFSDLNLTDCSIDESKNFSSNTSDFSNQNFSHELKESNKLVMKEKSPLRTLESISECDEENVYSSEDVSQISEDISHLSAAVSHISEDVSQISEDPSDSDNFSLLNSLSELSSEADSTKSSVELFDADGALATKILQNLNKTEDIFKKGKKRRIQKSEINDKPKKNFEIKNKQQKLSKRQIKKTKSLEMTENKPLETSSEHDSLSSESSLPFISISVSEMADQSFDEILGKYRYPTVKNLPSTNYTGTFEIDEDEIVIEELEKLEPHLEDCEITEKFVSDTEMSVEHDDTSEIFENSPAEPYTDSVKVYYGKKCCLFVLKHPAKLCFHGKVKVSALGGTVQVFGYTLRAEPCELYAPYYNFAQTFKTIETPNEYYGLFNKLTSNGLSVAEAEEIVTTLGEYDGILKFQQLNSRRIDFVDINFTGVDLFNNKQNKNSVEALRKATEILHCTFYLLKPTRCFEENPSWEEAVEMGKKNPSRAVICGGKGTGKSTFLRYYVNRLLTSGRRPVLVIDLDPGQAEFTVAGNVSVNIVSKPLLGPNFTHLRKPELMLNIGMINTMDYTTRYTQALYDLYLMLRDDEQYRSMPWVVNTMGMCNNMGLRFLLLTIFHTKPTFVLQIESKNFKKRFDRHLTLNAVNELYENDFTSADYIFNNVVFPEDLDYALIVSKHEDSLVKNQTTLAPRDERYLNYLAYFGELMDMYQRNDILGIVPYELNLKDINIVTNIKLTFSNLKQVINGKIVALCRIDTQDKGKMIPFKRIPFPCHGHGLIRGIDFERGLLYVVTAADGEALAQVNALVYCDWTPELRGQERHLPPGTAVPYRTATDYHQRQLMFPPRRRFNPLQLLKMSRSS